MVSPSFPSRSGSALLLVMALMVGCLSLVAGIQSLSYRRSTQTRIDRNLEALRTAVVLGLFEGMEALAADRNPAFDDPRETWGGPLAFESSEGVRVSVRVRDAQDRFNLNHLSLSMPPAVARPPEDVFRDLIALLEVEVDADPLIGELREEERTLQDIRQMAALDSKWTESLPVLASRVSALPHSASRPLRVNLNTVRPEVLTALVGSSLQPWVHTVVSARESAPIPSVAAATRGLPTVVRGLLAGRVDVRSDYFRIAVEAERDRMVSRMEALVRRSGERGVEVVRCRW